MNTIQAWYKFAIQQIVAESYIDREFRWAVERDLVEDLTRGNTNWVPNSATDKLYTKLTQSQATDFVANNQIIAHQANTASGFSATLTKENVGGIDEYTLSFRSTEYKDRSAGGDYERDASGADTEINNSGFAFAQIADMEAYYALLKANPLLLPAGAKLNVTGYSLGAHLATVFTEVHTQEVNHTYTFNGPGRGALDGNNVAGLVAELRTLMGSSTLFSGNAQVYGEQWYIDIVNQLKSHFHPFGAGPFNSINGGLSNGADAKITQLYGHANHDDVELVSNSGVHAPATRLYIEDQPNLTGTGGFFGSNGDFGTTHSIVLMVNTLALIDTLLTIAPTNTDADKLQALFSIASNQRASGGPLQGGQSESDSLEAIINALKPLVNADFGQLSPSRTAGDFGDITYRNDFYDALDALRTAASGSLQVVGFIDANQFVTIGKTTGEPIAIAAPWSAAALQAAAMAEGDTGLAYRYALSLLNSFALTGNASNYATLNTHHQFDKLDAMTDEGLSDQWIEDRAKLLEHKLYYNLQDAPYIKGTGAPSVDQSSTRFDAENIVWEDVGISSIKIQRGQTNPDTRYITFGSDKSDGSIKGGANDDNLYGNDGGDVMRGGAGADYLEGGIGHDVLYGDAGIDTLNGGIDNDILIGGADDDVLNGGKGLDSYLWTNAAGIWGSRSGGNDGTDTLIDSDKLGRIFINGQGVKLLIQTSSGLWTSPDGKVTLTQDGTWKIATTGDGGIDLGSAFEDGHFGIHRLQVAVGGTRIVGDLQPIDHDVTTPEIDIEYDSLGNVKVHANQPAAGREDRLYGSPEADRILGVDGSDRIDGLGGDDLIEGGSGSDIVIGDWGNDTVFGESGPNATSATTAQVTAAIKTALERGDSATNQSQRGDLVAGQTGNDILVGGDAEDLITGGEGNDLLIGGAGNDMLIGDGEVSFAEADWSVRRLPENDTIYRWQPVRSGVAVSDEIGGADMLYGGKGADWVFGGAGDDLLDGGAEDDVIFGDAGNDVIRGGDGADVLSGDAGELPEHLHGADWIDGGIGDDRIYGNSGDDVLTGGRGVDTINGGAGRDTYIFYAGDGVDKLSDPDTGENASIMVFGPGFDKNSITLEKGSLLINLGNGDEVHIENFNAEDPLADPSFSSFQFDDGSSLSWEELLALGFSIIGTEYDDQGELGQLDGTGVADRIFGLAGDDVLVGLDGDDVLNGGEGIDVMAGGAGDDIYDIRVGDALPDAPSGIGDFILDEGGSDTLRLKQHDPANIYFGLSADVLAEDGTLGNALMIVAGSDRIMLFDASLNNAEGLIDFVEFGNGERVAMSDLVVNGRTLSTAQVGASLNGTWANDNLTVNANAVTVDGGRGKDFINATGSGNTIVYTVGDGADKVTLSLSAASDNVLRLHGVSAADLALSKPPVLSVGAGDTPLKLGIGENPSDSIELLGLDHDQLLEQRPFDHIAFDDGSTLSYTTLLARGVDIAGTASAESLDGTSVDDRISGGAGNDFLHGGGGDDTYFFNAGDGADTIIDLEGANTLRFGEGLTRAGMSVTQEITGTETYLKLDFGNGDKVSILRGEFDTVQTFQFADGTTVSTAELLASLPNITLIGDDTANTLNGTNGDDVLVGFGGDDSLIGGNGNDTLDGGTGADILQGGAGSDSYLLGFGRGLAQVTEVAGEASVFRLQDGIVLADLKAVASGNDIVVTVRATGHGMQITDAAIGDWQIVQADGTSMSMANLLARPALSDAQLLQQVRQDVMNGAVYATAPHLSGFLTADGASTSVTVHTDQIESRFYGWTDDGRPALLSTLKLQSGDGFTGFSDDEKASGVLYSNVQSGAPQTWVESNLVRATTVYEVQSVGLSAAMISRVNVGGINVDYVLNATNTSEATDLETVQVRWTGVQSSVSISKGTRAYDGEVDSPTLWWGTPNYSDAGLNSFWDDSVDELDQATAIEVSTVNARHASLGTVIALGTGAGGSGSNIEASVTTRILHAVIADITGDAQNNYILANGGLAQGNGQIDLVDGAGGDDYLVGDERDLLFGNDGNDTLFGGATLIGGRGNDFMDGGSGGDVYRMLFEDGIDTIDDSGTDTLGLPPNLRADDHRALETFYNNGIATDRIVLPTGVTLADLQISGNDDTGYLLIDMPNGIGLKVALAKHDGVVGNGIELFEFADGQVLTIGDLIDRMNIDHVANGTSANEQFVFGKGNDVVDAGAGDDLINAGGGNDLIVGGSGDDNLVGGEGDDVYVFNRGDGHDRITQRGAMESDLDVVRFGGGITRDDVTLTRDLDGIHLTVSGAGGIVTITDQSGDWPLPELQFGDGGRIESSVLAAIPMDFYSGPDGGFIYGTNGIDHMFGGDGSDYLFGKGGDDTLSGGGSNDYLDGGTGNDSLSGGDGFDNLFGGDGNDTLNAENGGGQMTGGAGDDSFVVNRGDGTVLLGLEDANGGSMDVIRFGLGISPDDLIVSRSSSQLVIEFGDSGDSIVIAGQIGEKAMPSIEFADGSRWEASVLALTPLQLQGTNGNDTIFGDSDGQAIYGRAGDDQLYGQGGDDALFGDAGSDDVYGGDGNDLLDGGAGNDFVASEAGDDVYVFGRGDGADIVFVSTGSDGSDTLRFKASVLPSDVRLTKDFGNLKFLINDTGESILIASGVPLNRVEFANSTVWDATVIAAAPSLRQGSNNDDNLVGTTDNDYLLGLAGNDMVFGDAGNDVLDGGAGDDELFAGTGDDVFLFGRGDGTDVIYQSEAGPSDNDVIRFKAGISPADIVLTRDGVSDNGGVRLTISDTGDSIGIFGQGSAGFTTYNVPSVEFADSTVWAASMLRSVIAHFVASAATYNLNGTDGPDVLDGTLGGTILWAGAGNDILIGGSGPQVDLYGAAGNDTLRVSATAPFTRIIQTDAVAGDEDVVRLDEGVLPQNVIRIQWGDDLALLDTKTGNLISLVGWVNATDAQPRVTRVEFVDGTVWDQATLGNGWQDYAVINGGSGDDSYDGSTGRDVMLGRGGNDNLNGGDGDDVLKGGVGNDRLLGGSGSDVYEFGRGDGADYLADGRGNDSDINVLRFGAGIAPEDIRVFVGGDGDDLVLELSPPVEPPLGEGEGTSGDRVSLVGWFYGGTHISRVEFADGTVWTTDDLPARENQILGTADDDEIDGTGRPDVIYGLAGNDAISASSGNDVLIGGTGNDSLTGGPGNDVYVFNHGDGRDRIYQFTAGENDKDVIRFGAGTAPSDVLAGSNNNNDLVLRLGDSGAEILVIDGLGANLPTVKFEDGTVWNAEMLMGFAATMLGTEGNDNLWDGSSWTNRVIYGFAGDDAIYGNDGIDTVIGGTGDDTLAGGAGNDVYVYQRGDGLDAISQDDATEGDVDVVRFGANIVSSEVAVARSGDDLLLLVKPSGEGVRLSNWFAQATPVSRVEFVDGMVWDAVALTALAAASTLIVGSSGNDVLIGADETADTVLGLAGDDNLYGAIGNDVLLGGSGADFLSGGEGDDTLTGGSGSDRLQGGTGRDTYVFNLGDGLDTINTDRDTDDGQSVALDVIAFGVDIAPSTMNVLGADSEDGLSVVLELDDDSDSVTIVGSLADLPEVRFTDGTVWSGDTLRAMLVNAVGTEDDDLLVGSGSDDVLNGGAGEDTIFALGGSDTLTGGGEDDTLYGGDGNDVFIGGSGEDLLVGGAGDDVYGFNRGDQEDMIVASGSGNDRILFGADIAPSDVSFTADDYFTLTIADSDDSITIDADLMSLPILEFADGTIWDRAILLGKITNAVGTEDDDLLVSTVSNLLLAGGEGDDTYFVGGSSPNTYIVDTSGDDTLILDGVNVGDISLGVGSLKITVTATGQEIHLDDFDPENPYAEGGIEFFQFADGSVLNKEQLIDALGFHPTGTSGNDTVSGTSLGDVISGLAGNDVLIGRGGDDTYVYTLGDGNDQIIDSSGNDLLAFGAGITPNNIAVTSEGNHIVLSIANSGGSVRIARDAQSTFQIERIAFADETVWTAAEVLQRLVTNTAPTVAQSIAMQVGAPGFAFEFAVPQNVFLDADAGDRLTVSATRGDGSALPSWLGFDSITATFSGVPSAGNTGVTTVRLTATDLSGLTASTIFDLAIGPRIVGSASGDTMNYAAATFVGIAVLDGGTGNDQITGSEGSDIIIGGAGSDVLLGRGGNDRFVIEGVDAGYDRVSGGDGFDQIIGGSNNDDFRFYRFNGANTVERIDGGAGSNRIVGTTSGDNLDFSATEVIGIASIEGGDGNDTLTGGAGDDLIIGGVGSDVLAGGVGDDRFIIEGVDAGYDRVSGGDGFDQITGGSGNDDFRFYQFNGANTVERIDGGAGSNRIVGTTSGDNLDFSATELIGIASIESGNGNDTVTGSAGDDLVVGGLGSDVLDGGAGNDHFIIEGADAGYDRVSGGDGFDHITGGSGNDDFRFYQFNGANTVERIDGGAGSNRIVGTTSGDNLDFSATEVIGIASIESGDGNDTLTGSAGDDLVVGGLGSDVLAGGAGDDRFIIEGADAGYDRISGGDGFDQIIGSSGNDDFRFYQFNGANTVERIDGGAGSNRIVGTTSGDNLDFSATEVIGIASIEGGDGNDTVTGSAGDDLIIGGLGSDVLAGGAGDDRFNIEGVDVGYDRVNGGDGFDQIIGSSGNDDFRFYQFNGANTVERIDGGAGSNRIVGTTSGDNLDFSATEVIGIASIEGGDGNDTVTGSAGDDLVIGGLGSDVLAGGAGNDHFIIEGADAGYDRVSGGDGFDQITGGSGNDDFRFYQFTGANTVERIDGGAGANRIVGTTSGDNLDFAFTELLGIVSIESGDGNDTVVGSAGDDLIIGGTGSDVLSGGAGSDTYLFSRGDGADSVRENDATLGHADVVQFPTGVTSDQLWFRHVGNNLEVSVIGTGDKLTIQNWYLGEEHRIETFKSSDNRLLDDGEVENLVQAMSSFAPPPVGELVLLGTYQSAFATVIAEYWS